jgi:hypothetical protein
MFTAENEIYVLYYFGAVVFEGTYDDCYTKLAQCQPDNYEVATSKAGGYKIVKTYLWI